MALTREEAKKAVGDLVRFKDGTRGQHFQIARLLHVGRDSAVIQLPGHKKPETVALGNLRASKGRHLGKREFDAARPEALSQGYDPMRPRAAVMHPVAAAKLAAALAPRRTGDGFVVFDLEHAEGWDGEGYGRDPARWETFPDARRAGERRKRIKWGDVVRRLKVLPFDDAAALLSAPTESAQAAPAPAVAAAPEPQPAASPAPAPCVEPPAVPGPASVGLVTDSDPDPAPPTPAEPAPAEGMPEAMPEVPTTGVMVGSFAEESDRLAKLLDGLAGLKAAQAEAERELSEAMERALAAALAVRELVEAARAQRARVARALEAINV